jgi:hypothetical protein
MMTIAEILSHTPVWVWVLLAFIVSRGVTALHAREIAPRLALIVPVIFLLWGLSGLLNSRGLGLDVTLFVVWLAIGGIGGAVLARLTPTPQLLPATGLLVMPGSAVPLVLILAAFVVKYALAVAITTASDATEHAEMVSIGACVGGLFAGLFWGRTLALLRRALQAAGGRTDWTGLAGLVFPGRQA